MKTRNSFKKSIVRGAISLLPFIIRDKIVFVYFYIVYMGGGPIVLPFQGRGGYGPRSFLVVWIHHHLRPVQIHRAIGGGDV